MKGYTLQSGKSTITFLNKSDYLHFKDFLENGLKAIKKENKTIYFNDGSRLINISMPAELKKRYVLRDMHNKTLTAERYIKKYVSAL